MSTETIFELSKDGKVLYRGSENDCYMRLQRVQSQSADWAMKHNGYAIKPGTQKVYETLDEIIADAGTHQVTVQELLNGRTRVFDDWQQIALSDKLLNDIRARVTEIVKGQHHTRAKILSKLKYARPQHWGLQRMVIEKFKASPARIHYIDGQNMQVEIVEIRNYLKNL